MRFAFRRGSGLAVPSEHGHVLPESPCLSSDAATDEPAMTDIGHRRRCSDLTTLAYHRPRMSHPFSSGADQPPEVAVLVPCLNEAETVAEVVATFTRALPDSRIYVYDNGSSDDTVARAEAAGAIVRHEPRKGKGIVMRRMFADIDADVFVMVDGDATYDPQHAPEMVERLIRRNLDMVVAARRPESGPDERRGHALGNRAFSRVITWLFGRPCADVFSGYRALSGRMVKTFPAESRGFEIETELTVHAQELDLPVEETEAPYKVRDIEGSVSKLRTIPDGLHIARQILTLFRHSRPLAFFAWLALLMTIAAWVIGAVVIIEYANTGLVERIPSAVLATGLQLVAVLLVMTGFILDSVARGRREAKRLAYLAYPSRPGR